ncbi:MAG: hypothetical protein ACREIS_10300 [Nitrospiraceae bacterium]
MDAPKPAPKPDVPDPEPKGEARPKARKEIPLVSVPNDSAMINEEMAELFDEDKVTHKHGSAEPEAD